MWKDYACTVPTKGIAGTCSVLDVIHHVTHTPAALRIIEDQKIARGLIYDQCSLRDSRTTVVWLSPNNWYYGSRYGNVQFSYNFESLVEGKKIYWVEAHTGYSPHACRFLVTDEKVDHLPVKPYDPTKDEGPLRYAGGVWYWNFTFTGEFLLQDVLWLHDCIKVEFIQHHSQYCAVGGCIDRGKSGERAASCVIAQILSRSFTVINKPLIVEEPKTALSFGVEMGLSRILFALKAAEGKLKGPLKSEASVDATLRAALLQYSCGEVDAAIETTSLINSDAIAKKRLAEIVKDHFGIQSDVLGE